MSDEEKQTDEKNPAPPEESLADTEPVIHEEGKSLADPSKDLGERLAEIIERREEE